MKSRKKPSYSENRQSLGKILPIDTPLSLVIDISEVCNFKCNYCFRANDDREYWGYAKKNNLMSWDVFIKIIEQIKSFPNEIKSISLSNHGEPLCNNLIVKMIRYIKENNINSNLSIHTNASLLTFDLALELAQSKIDKIVISIQGVNKEKYERVCDYKIDFEQFVSNIKILYENKSKDIKLNIKTVDDALDSKEEELEFYNIFGPICDNIYIEKVVPIWKSSDFKIENNAVNKYGQIYELQDCCGLTFYTLVVSPDGTIYPCTQLLIPYNLGNIKEITLKDAWEGSVRKEWLIKQLSDVRPEICVNCYIKQNAIFSKLDMIDNYRLEIQKRLIEK